MLPAEVLALKLTPARAGLVHVKLDPLRLGAKAKFASPPDFVRLSKHVWKSKVRVLVYCRGG
jgi:hypothetical protein